MKTLKSLSILLLLSSLTFIGCSEEDPIDDNKNDDVMEMNTIVDVAKDNNFTILVSALERVDLASVLMGDGPFTVFAPTDDAFAALLTELEINSLDDVSDEVLTQILLNHVVSGKVMSTDLTAGYVNTLADGPEETKISLMVDLTDGVMLNNRSKVTMPDVMADNGVVHVVDKVILIPNLVDVALANPNFSILVSALTDERLSSDFVATLTSAGPFTVFAPTNDAFIALLESNNDWNGLADIPVETLEAVLAYHVINGSNVTSSEITDGATAQTVQGSNITLKVDNGVSVVDGQSNTSGVVIADVQTSNGVIHAINSVLIP